MAGPADQDTSRTADNEVCELTWWLTKAQSADVAGSIGKLRAAPLGEEVGVGKRREVKLGS